MNSVPRPHIYIKADGNRYAWAQHIPGDCDRTSSQTFASEFAAALVAAQIASTKRLPLKVSDTVRRLLVAHWYAEGWRKSAAYQSLDTCANQYERKGWQDYANEYWQAVYAEADSKPGLGGDYWAVAPEPVYAELEAVA